jgi:uncharacterized protein YegL
MGLDKLGAEKISGRPLEFIFLLDVSGSMAGAKIQSLNFAIDEAIPEMKRVAAENVNAQIYVRVITFGSYAKWHIAKRTPIEELTWKHVQVDGATMMGAALKEVAEALEDKNMPERGLPPVLVLVSDGMPSDSFEQGMKALLKTRWGKKAVKMAIAIGDDADHDILKRFTDDVEKPILQANNASDLVNYIRWASTMGINAASKGQDIETDTPKVTPPDQTESETDNW